MISQKIEKHKACQEKYHDFSHHGRKSTTNSEDSRKTSIKRDIQGKNSTGKTTNW